MPQKKVFVVQEFTDAATHITWKDNSFKSVNFPVYRITLDYVQAFYDNNDANVNFPAILQSTLIPQTNTICTFTWATGETYASAKHQPMKLVWDFSDVPGGVDIGAQGAYEFGVYYKGVNSSGNQQLYPFLSSTGTVSTTIALCFTFEG